jgi:putative membrane-bound dehydrogenase-like protein
MKVHTLVASLFLASTAAAQGLSPEEAVKRMSVPEGFEVRLVACEPDVRQPLTISFDDRGRIWVIQYLQYPNPAGLTPVKVDEYLRTVYDRVPEPPPKGPKGADKITILEDKDGDGRFETAKDFVTGLNIASGMCLGHGGVFVAQPPYLLFYPDKNGDDIPDGDPEVLLSGFGLEDTHSLVNSLQWGPDGWLYGTAGSTSTSKIRGIEFQQGIWRYHPITKAFELFAEGGGNTWGLDFDRHGNAIAGTNWGGFAMLHQVQGAYYIKGFAKHGPLHNPNTYGYFDHVPYTGFKGGHVTAGGVVYQGGAFPAKFNDQYIGCNVLSNDLYWHIIEPKGSSFVNRFGGDFLISRDPWFRPIDSLIGPDGALYVVDWYDARANHVDPRNNWDRSNGRIYRVGYKNAPPMPRLTPSKMSVVELVDLLKHPNVWYRGEARRILAERHDPAAVPALSKILFEAKDDLALQALWGLYVSGGFDEALALRLLAHENEDVRTWAIRLQGDTRRVSAATREALVQRAATEPSPRVRNQMACTAKRLPAGDALPILRELLKRPEDADDPQIPLLLWWALEDKAIAHRSEVLELIQDPKLWQAPLVRGAILERIGRRYMVEGDAEACARLLHQAPQPDHVNLLVQGMDKALEGRRLEKIPAALEQPLADLLKSQPSNLTLISFAIRLGSAEAYADALQRLGQASLRDAEAGTLVPILGQIGKPDAIPVLLKLLSSPSVTIRTATLGALQAFQDPAIADAVLQAWPRLTGALRPRALSLLTARPTTSLALLKTVDSGAIKPAEIPIADLQRIGSYNGEALTKLLEKHWGKIGAATPGEKRAQIASIRNILSKGKGEGNPIRGHEIFVKTCAVCHTLWNEGNKVGPELNGADRKNIDLLALNIVDPSAMVRPEFQSWQILTTDGQVLTGLIAEQTPQAVTLLDAKNIRTVIGRGKIQILKASALSLMPEKLLDTLTDPEVRDFFAYLQGDGPVAALAPQKADGPLPRTALLDQKGDLAADMVAGIDRFLLREIETSVEKRAAYWKRDTSSKEAYENSIAPNREHLRKILGVVDERSKDSVPEFPIAANQSGVGFALASSGQFHVRPIRWMVFRGIEAEGLMLVPSKPDGPMAIVLPDADQTPEMMAGIVPGIPQEHQIARLLAEHGCFVVIPVLIDRSDTYSVSAAGKTTNQPHREFVYRPAFEMGRTVIGYEVQKVSAILDFLERSRGAGPRVQTGVFGVGEGGLVALCAGALDPRIDVTWVGGYFESRQKAWQEPIYRNVFGLLREFGDAEIASLIAPRVLITAPGPSIEIKGPPAPRPGRAGAAPGSWITPDAAATKKEWERALGLTQGLPAAKVPESLDPARMLKPLTPVVKETGGPDPQRRQKRQFEQLVEDTQVLLRQTENVRNDSFWKKTDRKSIPGYETSTAPLRDSFYQEVIGSFEPAKMNPNPRSRLVYDEPKYLGYEVMLDVFPDVFAYGILLLPKDLKEGERRPVVVCQHGLEGRPQDVADPKKNVPAYGQYACRLAERGFVVFAPQNPYIGKDDFRTLQRKANLLGKHLFSIIIPQHHVILDWLAAQPFVDPDRIAFYGLSYGGKTAMRVPAVLKRYCLSICSADFNDWIWKNAATDSPYSYVTTGEYEIFEWNLGNTFNYAEMAALIAPRPFMVERGHGDGVAPDERVAYEFAKVKRLYDELKIGDRAELEVFDGPHKINGVGTFEFLHKHLKWPKPN